jgi:hypothetical protein
MKTFRFDRSAALHLETVVRPRRRGAPNREADFLVCDRGRFGILEVAARRSTR